MNKIVANITRKLAEHTSLILLVIISFLPIVGLATFYVYTTTNKDVLSAAEAAEPTDPPAGEACEIGTSDDPKWKILNEYDGYFAAAGKEFGIDPNILKGMSMIETEGAGHYREDGSVIQGCDQYGQGCAVGVMQVKPEIWYDPPGSVGQQIKADPYTVEGNIRLAAKLMADWTKEEGSWQEAIKQHYHPGIGQYGKDPQTYVNEVTQYMKDLKAGGCGDTSKTPSSGTGSGSRNKSTDESGCVITKVGNPQASPTIPPTCGSAPGEYGNPLATPEELSEGKLSEIVTGIATEMAAYTGTFEYGGHIEHAGLDIGTHGAARSFVYAVTDGEVTAINLHDLSAGSCVADLTGCTLRLEHSTDEYTTEYVHIDPTVGVGDTIKRGDIIGTVHVWPSEGGYNDHLHFELRLTENRYNINPRIYFPEFEQFPLNEGYIGGVRAFSASRGIHLEEEGGIWPEKFRDHPPCAPADRNGDGVINDADCWAM